MVYIGENGIPDTYCSIKRVFFYVKSRLFLFFLILIFASFQCR